MSWSGNAAIGLLLILLCSGCKKPPALECGPDEENDVPGVGAVDSRLKCAPEVRPRGYITRGPFGAFRCLDERDAPSVPSSRRRPFWMC